MLLTKRFDAGQRKEAMKVPRTRALKPAGRHTRGVKPCAKSRPRFTARKDRVLDRELNGPDEGLRPTVSSPSGLLARIPRTTALTVIPAPLEMDSKGGMVGG